jgi:serine/threonine-protein kinase
MQTQAAVVPGQIIAGKYRVERLLGQGGMGIVLAATHLQLEEQVAIKLLHAHASTPDVVSRFLREAKASLRIRSEHVVRVMDVGTLDDGAPYIVMEYLDGRDLAAELAVRRALGIEETIDHVVQACAALAEAHQQGIVHRDLKPANLFLTRRADGSTCVKVVDFGISKILGNSTSATRTGGILGSPLYMSPEQLTSAKDVDGRSDVWALGVILYELLAGAPPFLGEDLPQICVAILQAPLPPLGAYRGDLPPGLEGIIARCLERDRSNRFQSVTDLGRALLPYASLRVRHSYGGFVETVPTEQRSTAAPLPTDPRASAAAIPAPYDTRAATGPSISPGARTADAAVSTVAPGASTSSSGASRRLGVAALGLTLLGAIVGGVLVLRARPSDRSVTAPVESASTGRSDPAAQGPSAGGAPTASATAEAPAALPSAEIPAASTTSLPAAAPVPPPQGSVASADDPTPAKPKAGPAAAPTSAAGGNAYDRARKAYAANDFDAAEREARVAVGTHGNAARLLLAEILERKGRVGLAKDQYRKVLESDPTNATAKSRLAKLGG